MNRFQIRAEQTGRALLPTGIFLNPLKPLSQENESEWIFGLWKTGKCRVAEFPFHTVRESGVGQSFQSVNHQKKPKPGQKRIEIAAA